MMAAGPVSVPGSWSVGVRLDDVRAHAGDGAAVEDVRAGRRGGVPGDDAVGQRQRAEDCLIPPPLPAELPERVQCVSVSVPAG